MIFPVSEEVVPVRSKQTFAVLAAAISIGSVQVLSTTATADAGAVVTAVDAAQRLRMDPGSGLDGLATLWFNGGRVAFFGHRISGGTLRYGGEITVRSGARTAWLSGLSVDLGTGTIDATLDNRPLRLATVNTRLLRLHKEPGDKKLFVDIGSGQDEPITLTAEGASTLNTALGTDLLAPGRPLLTGVISAGLPVDEKLAAELNTDPQALIDSGVAVIAGLDDRIDLSGYLVRG